jgi:hypothetical protein
VVELVDDVRFGAAEAFGEGDEGFRRDALAGEFDDEVSVQRVFDDFEAGVVEGVQIDAGDLSAEGIGEWADVRGGWGNGGHRCWLPMRWRRNGLGWSLYLQAKLPNFFLIRHGRGGGHPSKYPRRSIKGWPIKGWPIKGWLETAILVNTLAKLMARLGGRLRGHDGVC